MPVNFEWMSISRILGLFVRQSSLVKGVWHRRKFCTHAHLLSVTGWHVKDTLHCTTITNVNTSS